MANNDDKRYVTYHWLIGSFGATLVAVCTIVMFAISYVNNQLDRKVDKEVFRIFCESITKIESTVQSNERTLRQVDKNQVRVMQKLGIPAVGASDAREP